MNIPAKYKQFKKINGKHPWRDACPDGYVDYPVRYREGGEVLYFNFPLARELGLISKKHPNKMNPSLEKAILETFSLVIINEYDQKHKTKFPKGTIRKNHYMATRYLQLQHESKKGKTSGDGRSVWNGYIKTSSKTFDVSSGGTGNTILSPGSQKAGKPIKTGDETYGYSSGLADVDEMLSAAIMSEIFYREGVPTERNLTVIKFKDKTGIGVRTSPNLLRPAHIFRYLKTGSWKDCKKTFDYFIKRQEDNKFLKVPKQGKNRYQNTLVYLAKTYAKLAAVMEEEYIFNWLAWDGDNVLASGAVLDYGSIRQFAAKHNKYRYDDVDRFSTCLTEQKREAKYLVQTFAQLVDFILTKEKKNIKNFEKDLSLTLFDEFFEHERQRRMLWRMGFNQKQIEELSNNHQDKIQDFRSVLNYFEHAKINKGEEEVPDGIDHPPIFLVRYLLRELPAYILKKWTRKKWPVMPAEDFCDVMAASYVDNIDLELTEYRRQKVLLFQKLYKDLIIASAKAPMQTLRSVSRRSSVINYENRRTGDGLVWIVDEALKAKNRMPQVEFQEAINRFIESQVLIPEEWKPITSKELKGSSMKARLLRKLQETLEIYSERI